MSGPKLRVAVLGAGCIGSMLAWHLVRDGGHEVTVVARGARLVQLQADKAVLDKSNNRAEVTLLRRCLCWLPSSESHISACVTHLASALLNCC